MTCGVMDLSELTAERVRDLLSYDSATGAFAWKYAASNRIKVGARAGSVTNHGYRVIVIGSVRHLEHRLAWLYATGEWPENQIDHINGIRDDNRFANLRGATCAENRRNTAKYKSNSSGFKGVSWDQIRAAVSGARKLILKGSVTISAGSARQRLPTQLIAPHLHLFTANFPEPNRGTDHVQLRSCDY